MRTRAILRRGLLFAMFWWVMVEGRADSLGVGMVMLTMAVAASLYYWPPDQNRISITGLLAFIGFFLVQSALGGVQIAAIALRPRLAIAPAILELPLSLPPGLARVVLINTLNLLPGTFGLRIDRDTLYLHVLDERWPVAEKVREAEARVARMLEIAP